MKLKEIVKKSGVSVNYIAFKLGMSRQAFSHYLKKDIVDLKVSMINDIKKNLTLASKEVLDELDKEMR